MATTAVGSVGRISGVAVALGIGAAVATGLAASAWAAPEEPADPRVSRSAAAVDGSATGETRGAAAHPAADRAVAAGPARRSAARGADTVALSAAPVRASAALTPRRAAIASVVVPYAGVPSPQPAAQPAPQPAPTAGQLAAAPAATQSATVRRAVPALSWLRPDPRGRLITIYKRTHFAIPNNFGFFVRTVTGTGTFTTNSAYDLGDEDQFDWNKFTGIAFTPLEPDRNSVMVGWRYNLLSQQFEVAPFYNVDKRRILPNENPSSPGYEVISVPVGQPFNFHVDYTGVTLSYGERTVFKPFPEGLTPNVWTAARVSGWFGGNEVAPRTISYFIKFA